ncbi:DUF6361 family protein [Blastopirellula marina]|uniref:Uncharacterized protein n=1 Tax=Blastopirellula marina TaxID=124 RepID=A0A2S8FA15_9BACT|nr:DUF6361 family protein [Blastopirellula marina]PQO29008.1 hypothetical protein C5Y98_22625 [Blastopirellula marina]PTL42280.1 hypothetical protein C5Y97_22635 [Blastopirellula marina]
MASTFTWLDYSEYERRKMLDVIELFGEKTTRDELGLGGIRDAFADLLFPGTSTVQTRAKYFLFVPWLYQSLEKKRTESAKVGLRGRKLEIELARQLELAGETDGVIGLVAKEKLQRLPSNIYWQGLSQWGIRTFAGSQEEYHRSLDLFYRRQRARRDSRHEHEGETADEDDLHNWHAGLPPASAAFPMGETLSLSREEAAYLRERLVTHCPQSLLAWLVREHVDVGDASYVWELEVELPATLRKQVAHGRNFSEVLHGAQLLYNLILAEQRDWSEKIEAYREELQEWGSLVSGRLDELQSWNRTEFWRIVYQSNPRVSSRARSFVQSWLDLIFVSPEAAANAAARPARQLVENREAQLKRGLARVRNERARELWNGAAGAAQLDLRWGSARRIAADILAGLEADDDA